LDAKDEITRRRFLRLSAWFTIGATGGLAALSEITDDFGQRGTGQGPRRRPVAVAPGPQGTIPDPTEPPRAPPEPVDGPILGPPEVAPDPAQLARWPMPTPGLVPTIDHTLRVPILMYHRIVDPGQAGDSMPGLVVPPSLFTAQMRVLHGAGWGTITAAELASSLQHGSAVPARTFVVTIDDGWRDGYTDAWPVLETFGYRATYYVIGKRIGARGFLSPGELQTLAAAGMEIGDHTFDHHALPSLPDFVRRFEITAAADRIAQVVGQAPVTFCYPDGRSSLDVESQVAQAGFGLALTTQPGARQSWSTRYALPRLRVTPSTSAIALLARMEVAQLIGN
jgi:peptidoglycan/xylan/chitin deacetylase (PgdA/CDA1 family)